MPRHLFIWLAGLTIAVVAVMGCVSEPRAAVTYVAPTKCDFEVTPNWYWGLDKNGKCVTLMCNRPDCESYDNPNGKRCADRAEELRKEVERDGIGLKLLGFLASPTPSGAIVEIWKKVMSEGTKRAAGDKSDMDLNEGGIPDTTIAKANGFYITTGLKLCEALERQHIEQAKIDRQKRAAERARRTEKYGTPRR